MHAAPLPRDPAPHQLLRGSPTFAALDDATLTMIAAALEWHTLVPGELLCREDEPGDALFLVERGEMVVHKGPRAVVVTTLGPGAIAGEMGLFGDRRRTATLRARTACRIARLGYAAFEQLLDRHPPLARALLRQAYAHLHRETSAVARLRETRDERLAVVFFHATPFRNRLYQSLNRHDYALRFLEPRLTRDTAPLAEGARVVVASANDRVDRDVVHQLRARGVELLALRCAGYNNVDLDACRELGLSVARVPAYSPHAVAEHAVALMLALNRRTHHAHKRVRDGNFSLDGLMGFDMHGRTAGVVGAGKIGGCLLDILRGFGCRLLVSDPRIDPALLARTGATAVSLDELLARADIVSLHAPLTPATHHLVDARAVARMKPGVMLINTSRGGLVDTAALVDGLKSGHIGYAGLDVYEEEEAYFFEDHSARVITDDVLARLIGFNNVMITSHQGSLTETAQTNIAETTLASIRELERDLPFTHGLVDARVRDGGSPGWVDC